MMVYHRKHIPFIRLVNSKWDVYCKGLDGLRVYVGRFIDRTDAFIEMNRVLFMIHGEYGLLSLQKGLRMKKGVDDRIREVRSKYVEVENALVEFEDVISVVGEDIDYKKTDNKLLGELFEVLGSEVDGENDKDNKNDK